MTMQLTKSIIRSLATGDSYAKGERYLKNGAVRDLVLRGSLLNARVEGSENQPYRVEVDIKDPESASCDCPYDYEGACKHVVAVLLAYFETPEKVKERAALEDLLKPLDRNQLETLLLKLIGADADLISETEKLLQTTNSTTAEEDSISGEPPPLNLEAIRERVARIFESAPRRRGHYGDAVAHPSVNELDDLVELTFDYLEKDDGMSALGLLESFTGELTSVIIEQLESGLDETDLDETLEDVGDLWTEAILSANPDERAKADYYKKISQWSKEAASYGYDALKPALIALTQGWDDPRVILSLKGEASPSNGVVSDVNEEDEDEGDEEEIYEEEDYGENDEDDEENFYEKNEDESSEIVPGSKEAAKARLSILKRRSRFDEYLNYSLAEGFIEEHLTMLVMLDRFDEAMEFGLNRTESDTEALVLAKALHEKGRIEDAYRIAEAFLAKPESEEPSPYGSRGYRNKYERAHLAEWLRDSASEQGQKDRALSAAILAFNDDLTQKNYYATQKLAGDAWPGIREEFLEFIRQSSNYNSREEVGILLDEGLLDDAINKVRANYGDSTLRRVVDAAMKTHPVWVFEACKKQFEGIADAGKANKYEEAVEWLKPARESLIFAGRGEEWTSYLDKILALHSRKYKLVPLLKQLY